MRVLVLIISCCIFIQLHAQYSVSGLVTDENNVPLEYVIVSGHGRKHLATTKADGQFAIEKTNDSVLCFSLNKAFYLTKK